MSDTTNEDTTLSRVNWSSVLFIVAIASAVYVLGYDNSPPRYRQRDHVRTVYAPKQSRRRGRSSSMEWIL